MTTKQWYRRSPQKLSDDPVAKNKNAAAAGLWKKPVRGKRGKPKAGFPPFPPPLEIAHNPRDSHFSHSPDCCCYLITTNVVVGQMRRSKGPSCCGRCCERQSLESASAPSGDMVDELAVANGEGLVGVRHQV